MHKITIPNWYIVTSMDIKNIKIQKMKKIVVQTVDKDFFEKEFERTRKQVVLAKKK